MMDWIALFAIRILSKILQVMPLDVALFLARLVGILLAVTNTRRRIAYVNLKAAFGNRYSASERKRIIKRHFCHLVQNAVEVLRFPKMDQQYFEQFITVEHLDRYEHVVRKNRGAILMTPHFGNWELSQILSALLGRPMYVLARKQKHSQLDDFLNQLRSSHGSTTILKGKGVRDLVRVLQEGGLVGLLGDLSGGREGEVIRFFGRKTTAPAGIFLLAYKSQATVLPCFMVRLKGPNHRVFIEDPFPLEATGDEASDMRKSLQNYYHLLEKWIGRYPDQWFWIYKRWKYCFTKRILILQDERAGHRSQAEAIQREFEHLGQSLGDRYDFEFYAIQVRFKSIFHRRLFYLFAFFLLPFAQGRLGFLNYFFESTCAQSLCNQHADLIVSAGASIAPLNLLLKRENLAKSVVIMRPSFPYGLGFFDLSLVPVHDQVSNHGQRMVQTYVTPSQVDEALLELSAERLKQKISFSTNGARCISVFIGGSTKSYRFDRPLFRKWLSELKDCAEKSQYDLLITTSRRTDPDLSDMVKEELGFHPATKLLIIANESNMEHAAYGMLALCDVALVTEESISMISDAVSAKKNVLVMQLGNGKLPRKHRRFHGHLRSSALIRTANVDNFRTELSRVGNISKSDAVDRQSKILQQALSKLL